VLKSCVYIEYEEGRVLSEASGTPPGAECDGTVEETQVFLYDADGTLVGKQKYDATGTIIEVGAYVYEPDGLQRTLVWQLLDVDDGDGDGDTTEVIGTGTAEVEFLELMSSGETVVSSYCTGPEVDTWTNCFTMNRDNGDNLIDYVAGGGAWVAVYDDCTP